MGEDDNRISCNPSIPNPIRGRPWPRLSGKIGQGCAEAPGGRREGIAAKVRPGIEHAMELIRLRSKLPIISEVLQIAIMKMDLMGDDELADFLSYPRHEIVISKNVARDFLSESIREIRRDSGHETFHPGILNK